MKFNVRDVIVLMIFLTTYINYTTRSNLSISLPAMVKTKSGKPVEPECTKGQVKDNSTKKEVESGGTRYEWAESVQGHLLAAYFYGYCITSLPAGAFAEIFGATKILFWTTLVAGILNSICVWVSDIHWSVLFLARVLVGGTGGLVYPALQCLIGRWAPPAERGKFVSGLMGNTLGTCITWIVVGAVTKAAGWPMGFHVVSIQILLYLVILILCCADRPESHKWIKEEEVAYIKTTQEGSVSKKSSVPPYKAIFTSFAFWTLCVLHFGNLWGLYVQITAVPKFMKEYIGFNIKNAGMLSSLPQFARLILGLAYGQIGDYLKRNKYKRLYILKGFISLSHIVPGILMACIGQAGCNATIATVLLILSMSINGAVVMTNLANPTDLAPNFAGTIFGIQSFVGGISGFIVPSLTGKIIGSLGNNLTSWNLVFFIGGLVYCGTGVFFIVFGTADTQPWNEIKDDKPEDA